MRNNLSDLVWGVLLVIVKIFLALFWLKLLYEVVVRVVDFVRVLILIGDLEEKHG